MSDPLRILFLRPSYVASFPATPRPFLLPTVPEPGPTREALLPFHTGSGRNIGNLVHTEAMPRILRFDEEGSAFLSLHRAVKARSLQWLVDAVNAEFDVVVFSAANFIRPEADFNLEYRFFEKLAIPAVLVGAGVQNPPPAGDPGLGDALRRFLSLADERFALFGVRGATTAQVLSDLGLRNVVPLGCPSFYAYPDNVARIAAPDLGDVRRILTAGHISVRGGPGPRYEAMARLLAGFPQAQIDYVLQNELFWAEEEMDAEPYYDPVTKEVSPDWARRKFFRHARPGLPVPRLRYFTDTSSWRMFAAGHDLYIGDRIHGGVVAMQARRPAVILHRDARVRELAEHIGCPNLSLDHLAEGAARPMLEKVLAPASIRRFQKRYAARLEEFKSRLRGAGLALTEEMVHSGAPETVASRLRGLIGP